MAEVTSSASKIHSTKRKKTHPNPSNCDAPRVKDLRSRRVFTPDVDSVILKQDEEEYEERKKILRGSDSIRVIDPDDVKVKELEKFEVVTSEVTGEGNRVENGQDLKVRAISGNGVDSKSKMPLKRCGMRKVFKTSSSFSYRRLLPYLMDIANDDSGVSKIEIVDVRIPHKLQKLDGINSEVRSTAENSYTTKVECVVPQSSDTNPSDNVRVQKFHTDLPEAVEITRPHDIEQKDNDIDEKRVYCLEEEECCQATPPDSDIVTKLCNGGKYLEANNLLVENLVVNNEKSNVGVLINNPNRKRGNDSVNRLVLNPSSQLKLFKTPGSLSYRRLLPLLMDISKNNSCASRPTQSPMPNVNSKKDPHPVVVAISEQNNINQIRAEESFDKQHLNQIRASSSSDSENSPVSSMLQSTSTSASSNLEPNSVTSETLSDPCMINDLKTEETPNSITSPPPPSPTINNDILTKQSTSEESGLSEKPEMCQDMVLERHDYNEESNQKVNLNETSSQIKVFDAVASSTNSSFKGILKRNPRGCRGLCICLHCASFRLHADRAFEFSRNQMHDAEEVASELMTELSRLRLLLEKSIATDSELDAIKLTPALTQLLYRVSTFSEKIMVIFSINAFQVLVKQACSRALETESLAKERLGQLSYDLNVHCRIPNLLQPKVTFTNYIQEGTVRVLDPSASTEKRDKVK